MATISPPPLGPPPSPELLIEEARRRAQRRRMRGMWATTILVAFAVAAGLVFDSDRHHGSRNDGASSAAALGPGGGEIYFVSRFNKAGGAEISAIRADGTHLRQVNRWDASPVGATDLSPDGTLGYISPYGTLKVVSPGETPRAIVSSSAESFAWAPDGDRLAFIGAGWLWTVASDGSRLTRVAHVGDIASGSVDAGEAVGWSPDGRRLVFIAQNEKLFVVDADGSNLTGLTPTGAFDGLPIWSPEGSWIGFVTNNHPNDSPTAEQTQHVAVVRPDGSARHVLTHGHHSDRQFAWSPDGTRLVISRIFLGTLALASPTGGKLQTLGRGSDASFSPDGKRIAFNVGWALFVMNIDGSARHRLAYTCCFRRPLWSVTR